MCCAKCRKKVVALYGIPTGRFNYMSDPQSPKWCYECYVEDYGTDEEREEIAIDRACDRDAFPNK
jgi:hypothetical protein